MSQNKLAPSEQRIRQLRSEEQDIYAELEYALGRIQRQAQSVLEREEALHRDMWLLMENLPAQPRNQIRERLEILQEQMDRMRRQDLQVQLLVQRQRRTCRELREAGAGNEAGEETRLAVGLRATRVQVLRMVDLAHEMGMWMRRPELLNDWSLIMFVIWVWQVAWRWAHVLLRHI